MPRRRVAHRSSTRLLLALAIGCLSGPACQRTHVLSGHDLEPDRRGLLIGGRGISLLGVDGEPVDASRIEVAPGRYRVRYSGRLKMGRVHSALAGAIQKLTCESEIEIAAGEQVRLDSDWDKGREQYSAIRWERDFEAVVRLTRSFATDATPLPIVDCESEVDCRRLDDRNVRSDGCDRW